MNCLRFQFKRSQFSSMNPLDRNSFFVSARSSGVSLHWKPCNVSSNVSFLQRRQKSMTRRRCIASDILCTLGSSANSE